MNPEIFNFHGKKYVKYIDYYELQQEYDEICEKLVRCTEEKEKIQIKLEEFDDYE